MNPSTPCPQERTKLHDEPYLMNQDLGNVDRVTCNSHGVTGRDHVLTGTEDILNRAAGSVLLLHVSLSLRNIQETLTTL